jgi:hypothetical protein
MPNIILKKGDRLPVLVADLFGPLGTENYSGVSGVAFNFKPVAGGSLKGGACVVLDASSAGRIRVSYAWSAADTDTAGDWICEFVATLGGLQETFPNAGQVSLQIQDGV